MRLNKQNGGKALTIMKLDDFCERKRLLRHSELLPDSIRCIICGPSNSGKTNLMINLLLHESGLRFENIYVYSKSLNQNKYQYLRRVISSVPSIGYQEFSDKDDVISPENAKKNSVIIFDDVSTCSQDTMREYFTRGRHSEIDCFYLTQTYTHVPRMLMRDNCNMIIAFPQGPRCIYKIYEDHCSSDMTFQQFREMCSLCWKNNKYEFLVIDKDRNLNEGRYRKNFNDFFTDI